MWGSRPVGRPAAVAAGASALAAAVLFAGSGRPAYWLDEGTTISLVRRTWRGLLRVIVRSDPALGPYYLPMKQWVAISAAEWWVRLPSTLALVLAVGLLAGWVTARIGAAAGIVSAAAMLSFPAVSRYAQEARPYGLATLACVLSWLAWWRLLTRPGRRSGLVYAVAVLVLPLLHVIALTMVPAQALAARLLADQDGRRAALRTIGWATPAVLLVSPYLFLVLRNARGVGHPLVWSWHNAWLVQASALGAEPLHTALPQHVTQAVLVLSALGLTRLRRPELRPALVPAACWALLPTALILGLGIVRPALLVPRYLLGCAPGWAVLAGQGAVVVGLLVRALAVRLRTGPRLALVPAGVAAALALAVPAWIGLPRQLAMRSIGGHGDGDVRTAIAMLAAPPYRDLPVVVVPYEAVLLAGVYDPHLTARMPLYRNAERSGRLVLSDAAGDSARSRLAGDPTLVVLYHTTVAVTPTAAGLVRRQTALAGYRRVSTWSNGLWTVLLMTRAPPGGG